MTTEHQRELKRQAGQRYRDRHRDAYNEHQREVYAAKRGKPVFTQARLRELLNYDPETGVFTNRVKRGHCPIGSIAGCITTDGRRIIAVDGYRIFAARLACLYMTGKWPKEKMKHLDGNPDNCAWANLEDRRSTRPGRKDDGFQRAAAASGLWGIWK